MLLRNYAVIFSLGGLSSTSIGAEQKVNENVIIDRPTTTKELLRNIKTALDHSLFLKPEFHEEGQLLSFFNGTSVRWLWKRSTSKTADIVKFGDESGRPFVHITEVAVSTKLLDGTGRENADGKLTVNIGIGGILEPEFNLESVEDIFGQSSAIEKLSPPSGRHRFPAPPETRVPGNIRFRYTSDTPVESREIAFTTNRSGIIASIEIKEGIK